MISDFAGWDNGVYASATLGTPALVMLPLPVVPQEPVDQPVVERRRIISEERPIGAEKFLIQRAVEPLHARVHLRTPRVGVEVRDADRCARGRKVQGELAPVIGLYRVRTVGNHGTGAHEKVRGAAGTVVGVSRGKRDPACGVDTGDDVALHAVDEADDGIRLEHAIALRTAQLPPAFLRFSLHEPPRLPLKREGALEGKPPFLFQIGKDPADGGRADTAPFLRKKGHNLVFAKTGMRWAQGKDALDDRGGRLPRPPALRSRASRIEPFRLAPGCGKLF